MNRKLLAPVVALAFAFSLPAQAQAHDHHEGHGPQKLTLNAGKKWETDASLRQAMGNINQAMGEALPRIHGNGFGDGDYRGLADKVRKEIAYAVENCRLAPKADAMLHLVIADLAEGADGMEGKGSASRHDGAARVLQGLQAYGRYFRHPGWKAAGADHRL